jgi:hypothetical protein
MRQGARVAAGLAALALLAGGSLRAEPLAYRVSRSSAERSTPLPASDPGWSQAPVLTWGPARYATSFRALWSAVGLHLRFDATDDSPWSTMTKRDEHLWDEEVVEIFIDLDGSGRDYYELEINPKGVVCDLRMISAYPEKKGDIAWDLAGLAAEVVPLPGAGGEKEGWTALAFLPWSGLRSLPSAAHVSVPPRPGDAWRFNVFRIKRPGGPRSPEKDAVFAAWSPPTVSTFHDAGAFRPLVFGAAP